MMLGRVSDISSFNLLCFCSVIKFFHNSNLHVCDFIWTLFKKSGYLKPINIAVEPINYFRTDESACDFDFQP